MSGWGAWRPHEHRTRSLAFGAHCCSASIKKRPVCDWVQSGNILGRPLNDDLAAGVAAFGAVVLIWTRPFLGPLLVDIDPSGPAVIVAAITALIAAVAFAIVIPARSALAPSPARILREL